MKTDGSEPKRRSWALTELHITIVYCIGIFAASWVSQLAGIRAVRGDLGNGAITPWLIVAMITPALGVLLLMAFYWPVRGKSCGRRIGARSRLLPVRTDPHVSFVWHDCGLQLDGLGTVCLVRVFPRWCTGVGRALAIRPRNSRLAPVFVQHRHNDNGIFTGRDDFRRR